MPLQTIEPRRLYRQIADQLRALIERGEVAPGARLPPERDLALQLGVSRPSVREALIALEVEGRVEVRMGSGVYALPPERARPRAVSAESPLETIRARALIESALAAQAALQMRKAQVAGLRNAVALMRQEVASGHSAARGDRLFHLRIAEAADNPVLERIVGELYDERHNPLGEQFVSHFESAHSWAAAIAEHEAVIDAIASRSPEAARAAMTTHLANSHGRFTASISAAARVPGAPARRRPARKAA
ncbi:MAG TPA: FadR/GntR family transcriptional regulator [Burkholderiaceae bacterium]|nr:FadR/GntR family transcriptional regulator [Burkholderiaceae bacterium]